MPVGRPQRGHRPDDRRDVLLGLRLGGPSQPEEGAETHALILADGERPSTDLLKRLVAEADLFVATDGAANALSLEGPFPHVVLGDFDSLDVGARERLQGKAEFVDAWDQEACDLEKALVEVLKRGADRVTIAGAGGGRADHALTAVSLLVRYHLQAGIRLVDDLGEVTAVSAVADIRGADGDTLSLIAFERVDGVTLEGVRWPLRAETLHPGSRGVSNEMLGDFAQLSVRSGTLIVCHLRSSSRRGRGT